MKLSINSILFIKKIIFLLILCSILFYTICYYNNKKILKTKNTISEEVNTDKISSIAINIPQKDYDFLFSDIPTSLRTYQKGKAIADNIPEEYNISLRIRGNHAWHWNKEKPSFRLRIRGEKQLYKTKELDFINPEDPSGFSNFLANIMASKIGLAHFKMAFSQVTINNEYRGIYQIVDPIVSHNLITEDNIKGTIINGNSWDRQIWKNPNLWEIEDDATEDIKQKIQNCLNNLILNFNPPINPKLAKNLNLYVDMQKFAKWSAFMTAIGSLHTDDFHNNFYAYDTKSNRLLPVVADPAGFGSLTSVANENSKSGIEIPLYEFLTPLQDLAFRDPEFLYLRNKYLYEYIENLISPTYLETISNKWKKTIEPFYYLESNTAGAVITVPKMFFSIRLPVSANFRIKDITRINDYYRSRCDYIKKELNDCELEIYTYNNDYNSINNNIQPYIIRIKGNSPFYICFEENEKCFIDTNLNKYLELNEATSTLLLYPAIKRTNYISEDKINWLMLGNRFANYILAPDWQTYLVGFKKDLSINHVLEKLSKGKNLITGNNATINIMEQTLNSDNLYVSSESLHIWSIKE